MRLTRNPAVLISLFALARSASGQIDFSDFSDIGKLALNGHASQAGSHLRVAPALGNTAGSAWFHAKQRVLLGFDTTFSFQLTDPGSDPNVAPGADGFAFVIQNSPAKLGALGGHGSFLGYSFIPKSLAVEFDTYSNLGDHGLSDNHISVHTRGTANNLSTEQVSKGAIDVVPDMNDGNVHTARVTYNGAAFRVYLDDLVNPVLRAKYNLGKIGLSGESAYVGFTAGTGSSWQNHDILSWKFSQNVPEPGTWAFLGALGLAGAALLRRRSR
jgi:hypothetical protein